MLNAVDNDDKLRDTVMRFSCSLKHLGLNCGHFLCSSRDTPSVCSVSAALHEITILIQLVAAFNKTF
jgi:hypothetical protein